MRKINKIIRIIFSFLIISSFVLPYQALAFSIPTPTQAMNEILANLGINKSELKKNVNVINYDRYKKQYPQVSLTSTPSNPVLGQKVTVTATPSYFLNDSKNNYFTWFLKTADCTDTHDHNYHYNPACDLNGDYRVNIEDYKIKAMQILANNDFNWQNESYIRDTDSDGYKAILGGADQGKRNDYCFIRNVTTGLDYELKGDSGTHGGGCGHLFPNAPGYKTGDGSFGAGEESFWHTNPNNPDTAGSGNGDEANVTGLGMDTFSWNYSSGDKIGVVVEGVSVDPAETKDSSYKIMWATPKPLYGVNTNLEEGTTTDTSTEVTDNTPADGQRTTTITTTTITTEFNDDRTEATITTQVTVEVKVTQMTGDQNVISDTTTTYDPEVTTEDISDKITINKVSDINDLLYKVLTDPQEGGSAQEAKLDVSLSYTPDSPINDPSIEGSEGDYVMLTSSVSNADDADYANYTWQVYQSDELNPADWGEPLLKSQLADSTATSGVGLSTFSFKLNLPYPKKYLRVKLTVKENVSSDGKTREGYADVVIPINSSTDRIQVLNTNITDTGTDNPILSLGDVELCKDGMDKTLCPVIKDQIVALKGPEGLADYSWTIDGEPFKYKECFFDGCDPEKQTSIAFFPVLEDTDYQYTVNLTATDVSTGKKVNLTRLFQIVDPSVKVSSVDLNTVSPVLLGSYIDMNGESWPDYSERNFQAASNATLTLKADFIGPPPAEGEYVWYVDGAEITSDNAQSFGYNFDAENNLLLPGKSTGESYDVGIRALYAPDNLTKKALNAYWDVSYGEFYENDISNSVNIDSMDSISDTWGTQVNSGKKKILASVISSTPAYFAFLFRIVLTAFILLISSKFILSFFSDINIKREP